VKIALNARPCETNAIFARKGRLIGAARRGDCTPQLCGFPCAQLSGRLAVARYPRLADSVGVGHDLVIFSDQFAPEKLTGMRCSAIKHIVPGQPPGAKT